MTGRATKVLSLSFLAVFGMRSSIPGRSFLFFPFFFDFLSFFVLSPTPRAMACVDGQVVCIHSARIIVCIDVCVRHMKVSVKECAWEENVGDSIYCTHTKQYFTMNMHGKPSYIGVHVRCAMCDVRFTYINAFASRLEASPQSHSPLSSIFPLFVLLLLEICFLHHLFQLLLFVLFLLLCAISHLYTYDIITILVLWELVCIACMCVQCRVAVCMHILVPSFTHPFHCFTVHDRGEVWRV